MAPGRAGFLKRACTEFREKWVVQIRSAVRCQDKSLDACLTFFNFPEGEWVSLRTTNIIERLNRE